MKAALHRLIGSALAGSGWRGQLIILMYHRVLERPDPLLPGVPDARLFDMHMAELARSFRPLSLDMALSRLASGTLPRRSVCVTFDDGYADNHDVALPILDQHRIPATIFVAPGFLDGGYMWNDGITEVVRGADDVLELRHLELGRYTLGSWQARREAMAGIIDRLKYRPAPERARRVAELLESRKQPAPRHLMMSTNQVKAVRGAGHLIGAHTMTHPILTQTPNSTVRAELAESKSTLERLLNEPVDLFAYPNGNPDRDYALRHVEAVRHCGFKAAVSVSWGCATPESDPYQLPRIWPWDRTPARFAARLWRTYLSRPPRTATS